MLLAFNTVIFLFNFLFFRTNDKYATTPRKAKFLDFLLKNPLYSAWIVPGEVDPLSRSKSCCKNVDVSNIGESALKSHLKR